MVSCDMSGFACTELVSETSVCQLMGFALKVGQPEGRVLIFSRERLACTTYDLACRSYGGSKANRAVGQSAGRIVARHRLPVSSLFLQVAHFSLEGS